MMLMAGLTTWLLASFARSEDNIVDNLNMFDNIDSTLGMFEKNFGESITKKLSYAIYEGTQNKRSFLDIISRFMQELTPEDIDMASKGVIGSVRELAEMLQEPGAQDQLTFFIKSAPDVFATVSALTGGGGFGSSSDDEKSDSIPGSNWNEGTDPFASTKIKKRGKNIADYEEPNTKENTAEDVMELAGELFKTGASLLGHLGSSVSDHSKRTGGIRKSLVGFASKMLEHMIEEGVVDQEFLASLAPDDGEISIDFDEQENAKDEEQTKEKASAPIDGEEQHLEL